MEIEKDFDLDEDIRIQLDYKMVIALFDMLFKKELINKEEHTKLVESAKEKLEKELKKEEK